MKNFWLGSADRKRDEERQQKIEHGKRMLFEAAASTAAAADAVTHWLRNDSHWSKRDAVLLCNTSGEISQCNETAVRLFKEDVTHEKISDVLVFERASFNTLLETVRSDPALNHQFEMYIPKAGRVRVEVTIKLMDAENDDAKVVLLIRPPSLEERYISDELYQSVVDTVHHTIERIKEQVLCEPSGHAHMSK